MLSDVDAKTMQYLKAQTTAFVNLFSIETVELTRRDFTFNTVWQLFSFHYFVPRSKKKTELKKYTYGFNIQSEFSMVSYISSLQILA